MARYFTTDRRYHCEPCNVWISEREMVPATETDTPGGYCPGCLDTMWMNIVIFGAAQENAHIVAQVVA